MTRRELEGDQGVNYLIKRFSEFYGLLPAAWPVVLVALRVRRRRREGSADARAHPKERRRKGFHASVPGYTHHGSVSFVGPQAAVARRW